MGLDAFVYCNCFETGKLLRPPRADFDVSVSDEGGLECGSRDLDTQIAFDAWRSLEACEHEDGKLLQHRIGNLSLVGRLRQELNRRHEDFPVILTKVISSGSHCGDFLAMDDIRQLQLEVPRLKNFPCSDEESQALLDRFHDQLVELIECAAVINKPIVF